MEMNVHIEIGELVLSGSFGIGIILSAIFLCICFNSLLLHIGAGLVGIEERTFCQAILGTLGAIVGSIVGITGIVEPVLGGIVALIVSTLIIMLIYKTSLMKAMGAYVIVLIFLILVFLLPFAFLS